MIEEQLILPGTEEIMKVDESKRGWGKVLVGVRLEKMVEASFFRVWTELLNQGLREGDGYIIAEGMIAHRAANYLARKFIENDDYDTLFFMDSDCIVKPDFLTRFRDYEEGWEYDVLQAFYTRRGWPPSAIWIQETAYGDLKSCIVLDADHHSEVALIGLHSVLIRREVFETMCDGKKDEFFEWFFYPRNDVVTEDAAFSFEARKHGFKLGATTHVKAGHVVHVPVGWETYQDWLYTSGSMERIKVYEALLPQVSAFTGETTETILAKAGHGSLNVREAWEKTNPFSPDDVRGFYGEEDNGYLYDLFAWNTSLPYMQIVVRLNEFLNNDALVIGAGLGVEVDFLREKNNVWAFELPGILADFLAYRFEDKLKFLPEFQFDHFDKDDKLKEKFNLIVAVDVIEHVHPDEIKAFLKTIDWLLAPGGTLFVHNNFGDQEIYPMHYDHSKVFEKWCKDTGLELETILTWRKPKKESKNG